MDHAGVVIAGAGAAGAIAAATLRRGGYAGRIVVIRGEGGRPYNRTTVNKALLQGLVGRAEVELPEAEASRERPPGTCADASSRCARPMTPAGYATSSPAAPAR